MRARAVEALGKLQEPHCVQAVSRMLKDLNSRVRLEAAFALGQIGDPEAEEALIAKFNRDEKLDMKIRIVEALGKIGTEKTFALLMRLLRSDETDLRAEAALSAGRMALRGLTNQTMTDSLTLLLDDKRPEVRWKACYALMRIGQGLNVPGLKKALKDKDARVRMFAIQALGNLKEISVLETFASLLRKDPDWRVRVKVASALGNYPLGLVANYLSLLNQESHVRKAMIQAIGNSVVHDANGFRSNSREHNFARHQLEQGLKLATSDNHDEEGEDEGEHEVWPPSEIGAALMAYAQLLGDEAIQLLLKFTNYSNPNVRARAMEALGETLSPKVVRILERNYAGAPAIVKIGILNAFAKIEKFTTPRLFLDALQENDAVLVALAAQGLGQDSLKNKIYAQPIIAAYQRLPKPVDAEPAQMIFKNLGRIGDKRAVAILTEALSTPDKAVSKAAAQALERITGADYSAQIAAFTRPHAQYSYDDITALNGAKALIKTNRGTIEIALYTDDAPLTVLNFVRLAEKGFFDRLTFHRVVPNFVIQGGDPRGDGWGTPGYAIRSEFNKRPYLRGTVGMASAGKDTEGCQFFITHSVQPHLDGRYTVFGQVTSGMDIVDAIQEGDVMELVSIRR